MEMNSLMQAVTSVGFPIVMCFVMIYYIQKKDDDTNSQIKELSQAINNNTLVMTKLLERLDK